MYNRENPSISISSYLSELYTHCAMKRDTIILISSASSRSYSKNVILIIFVSFLFATTFLLLSAESSGSVYFRRQTIALTVNDKGRDAKLSNGSTSNTSCARVTIDHGCYQVVQDSPPKFMLMKSSELQRLNCSKREPSSIIIGTKKSGTTTLKNFLSYHPEIAFAERELKFVNNNPLAKLDDYRAVMPYSTPYQVPMEKTPGYFVRLVTAKRLQRLLPNIKLIVILRDPVKRAISDYVHMRYVDTRRDGGAKLLRKGRTKLTVPRYEASDSFPESVLYRNGSVKDYNSLIDSGLYIKYFRQWLNFFSLDQILVLDGEEFVKNPTPTMRKVESFLGIRHYFTEDHFYFDEQKHFFCLKKPLNTCMSVNKGRPHPEVSEHVLEILSDYFRPYNRELDKLLNRTFSWS